VFTGLNLVFCAEDISTETYNILETLYNSTAGWNWRWEIGLPSTRWNFPCSLSTPCSAGWQGLTCTYNSDQEVYDIKTIDLQARNLTGTLPPELGNLQGLTQLYLNTNALNGTIPSELGRLQSMIALFLDKNSFIGTIPSELGNIQGLVNLYLDSNSLSGTIPSQLASLQRLTELYLTFNSLTGVVPSELCSMESLTDLDLSVNFLSGSIPSGFSNLQGLSELLLAINSLTGPIPDLATVESLTVLDFSLNSLSSTIPSDLGRLHNLANLDFNDNFLSRELPSELGNLFVVSDLYLDSNFLTGQIPSELGNILQLWYLQLNDNLLEGAIPSNLCNIKGLLQLSLFHNMLSSVIPSEIGKLSKLAELSLNNNMLESTVPSELGLISNINVLYLYENLLTGATPDLSNLTKLEVLYLNDNLISGSMNFSRFPANLSYLDLGGNAISGALPSEMNNLALLTGLNLSDNRLSGQIDNIGDFSLSMLQSLDLSENYFRGKLPYSLFTLQSLKTIVLTQNCFSGTLPSSMCLNSNLSSILLDLLTGNCARESDVFKGFVLNRYLQGSIPDCVWNSSSISLLHLLGNGLTGSIMDVSPNSQFAVLALGSNQLSGTIPKSFQLHNFTQLDLSINRLSGTLESDLNLDPQTTTVFDLSINRLSGDIPGPIYDTFEAGVLNVLEGNLFGCEQSDVPDSDVSHASYQCGSLDLEYALLTWLVLTALTISVVAALARFGIDWAAQIMKIGATKEFIFILRGPASCLGISLIALVAYVSVKVDTLTLTSATYSVQYWWKCTVVFAHGWIIYLLVFSLLAASTFIFSLTAMFIGVSNKSSTNADTLGVSVSHKCAVWLKTAGAHAINVIMTTGVNAVYILIVTDSITGLALLLVQAALGGYKLIWSAIIIPRLLPRAESQLSHWIFMVLVVFVGSPFISTFCESSSCFRYVLTSAGDITYSFVDPFPFFDTEIDCVNDDCISILYSKPQTLRNTILSPWIYSFQCSSAVVTNYAPVLFLSYLVSGVIIPLSYIVIVELSPFAHSLVKRLVHVTLLEIRYSDNESAVRFLEKGSLTKIATKMSVKFILSLAVMLTFGLAVPLLNIAIMCDTVFNLGATIMLLDKFIVQCMRNGLDISNAKDAFWRSFLLPMQTTEWCYIVLGFVSVFWSLFAFDWIADVYGSLAGGLAMLVPLLVPMLVALAVLLQRDRLRERILGHISMTIELESRNPIIMPQTTKDDFVTI
jgi:Leucine-rich repeat (LRR) protein